MCTGTHAITQADLDAGTFTDTGHATSADATAPDAPDTIQAAQNRGAGVHQDRRPEPANYDTVGQLVTYTLTATNTGNNTLHNVTVSDTPTLTGFSCTPDDPGRHASAGRVHRLHRHPCDHPGRPRRRHVHRHRSRHQHRNRRPRCHRHHPSRTERGRWRLTKTDDLIPANYDTVGQIVHLHADRHQHRQHHLAQRDRRRTRPTWTGSSCAPDDPGRTLAPGEHGRLHRHSCDHPGRPRRRFVHRHRPRHQHRNRRPRRPRHHSSRPDAVLALTKTDDLTPRTMTTVGQIVTYTLTATNTGDITLHNVTVSDTPNLDAVLVPADDPGRSADARRRRSPAPALMRSPKPTSTPARSPTPATPPAPKPTRPERPDTHPSRPHRRSSP